MKDSKKATRGSTSSTDFDVIIVGAGISGINAAYYLTTQVPGASYAILDGRTRLGGTWDLFRYPGIRSDSDMVTFGFSWNPWDRAERLASGENIRAYLQKSAETYGIDKNIHFNRKVLSADWGSKSKSWTLATTSSEGKALTYRAKFILIGTGYYDYSQPLDTKIPGLGNFEGQVIYPQFWPKELDYAGKDVVVIGSGATAITIIPSMAEKTKSITMLQRSPTYIVPQPKKRQEGFIVRFIEFFLSTGLKSMFRRTRSIIASTMFYNYCLKSPAKVKALWQNAITKLLPAHIGVNPHFNPKYGPWTQRVCASPGGDFYAALRSGKANIITDTIKTVTATEIQLVSGQSMKPDIIIAATGLKLQFAGGMKLSVDGVEIDAAQKYTWKGSMIQDVPNLMFVIGYVNASWTMGAEVVAQHLVRVLGEMKRRRAEVAVPRLTSTEPMPENDVFRLSSTYMQTANRIFPKAGSGIWDHKRSYIWDMLDAQFGSVTKGLSIE
ncbi:FAD/NAD(P)-binding domain-containing protein [Annulohypoxylon maeteangense]|uniref:FAD/NAD(P)-binding domain-containing protein n=1 Tax=Annulohypoxylon maeteangense TaxID=1927788 RepID=UPI00200898C3|nr:FAD/NAD(P)-binding domain-containing protein [Annulohypoxylon maeteangense]KAI0886999.1 FAD/NAD(P)-binding domain-containing protein [Annulohypoxylon maeteangense]